MLSPCAGAFLFKSLLSFFICACLCASRPLLFHSAIPSKPYKPGRFLIFLLFFRIEEKGLGGLGNGMLVRVTEAKKKQDQTNFFEIHLTLLHVFYVLFHLDTWMGLSGMRTFTLLKLDKSLLCSKLFLFKLHPKTADNPLHLHNLF